MKIRPPPTSTLFPYTTLFRSSIFTVLKSGVATVARWTTYALLPELKLMPDNCATIDLRSDSAEMTPRSEEHTSELQSRLHLVCRLLLEKKNKKTTWTNHATRS